MSPIFVLIFVLALTLLLLLTPILVEPFGRVIELGGRGLES